MGKEQRFDIHQLIADQIVATIERRRRGIPPALALRRRHHHPGTYWQTRAPIHDKSSARHGSRSAARIRSNVAKVTSR